jgi:periplasmic protein TonB
VAPDEKEDVMSYASPDTRKSLDPLSLGATVLINGSVLAGLLFAAPQMLRHLPGTIMTIPIAPDKDPPPPLPPKTHPKELEVVDHIKPLVTPPLDPFDAGTVLETHVKIDAGPVGPLVIDPPKPIDPPPPVLTTARPDPRAASRLQPPYPSNLQRAGIEGVAVVRILIGTDGHVKQVELVRTDDPGFFSATAEQARRYWLFRPATRDGSPVESWQTMTVRFRMEA